MNSALAVLFGGNLQKTASQNVFSGKSAYDLALEKSGAFPHTAATIVLTNGTEGDALAAKHSPVEKIVQDHWTKKTLIETLVRISAGFDMVYFVWADTPFLDAELAGALAERHTRYHADYTFADGYPAGLAPEVLSPECIARLAHIAYEDGAVTRDALFSVLQKDINGFDIEVEIAPFDLRSRRLTFAADSNRNLLLLRRLFDAGFSKAADAEKFVVERPEMFRTLPAFFPIQVAMPCAQTCAFCPYPQFGMSGSRDKTEKENFLSPALFETLLDNIIAFSGDAVIDLSLWGEVGLHPRKMELIRKTLERPALSLIIETAGIGWNTVELEALSSDMAGKAARGVCVNGLLPPLSWIVSLDAFDAARYKEVRGAGYAEAVETAKTLAKLFPGHVYVQAVRLSGAEDDIERFYRFWKAEGLQVIIQKYDTFCGALPSLRVSDLSPVERQPCWHLMRDMPILIDGTVPLCRETICAGASTGAALSGRVGTTLGNAFSEDLETVWQRGNGVYMEHAVCKYTGICTGCDEYYTYNI